MGIMTNCEMCGKYSDCGLFWIDSNFEDFKERQYCICDNCKDNFIDKINKLKRNTNENKFD